MYRLTEKRFAAAETILENHRAELFESGRFNAAGFERELRELWDTGYQEIKQVAEQLLKYERYREVAVYYMEHSNSGPGVAAEFKIPLAQVYGIRYYDASERDEARKAYWAKALNAECA